MKPYWLAPLFSLALVGASAQSGKSTAGRPVIKKAPGPRAAQKPKSGKAISGTGFTLQERGSLESDARDYLGTPATEAAVRRGLAYLARTQLANGSWDDDRYRSEVAIAGLCALAFMSAGHQPDRGPFGRHLRKTTDYLADSCQRSGLILNPTSQAGPPMYGHGFATLALAELYGMTRRSDLRDPLENAVSLIIRTQNEEGGWRYMPRIADADMSVVVCQVMALRAAANAGVRVPRQTTSRAVAYVKRCANNDDGGYSYMPTRKDSGLARTGAGVLCLIVMGERDSPECRRGLEYLANRTPVNERRHPFYAHYYCTQAAYQAGGKLWRYWFPRMSEHLLSTQREDGSWDDSPGAPYATAMGVLALQVPAALLPIYQK